MLVLVISCALAALLGFAAQRASICNVRAVAELIGARTGYMLASIAKSVLWVVVITIPFLWFMPAAAASLGGWRLSWISLLGGLLFGIGAAVNGACAFSTLARLADGQLAMLGTLTGFLVGIVGFELLAGTGLMFAPTAGTPLVGSVLAAGGAMAALVLALWGLYEAGRLWRTRAPARLRELAVARQYRLSTAAMLIGLANGVLYLVDGAWGYTGTLQQSIEGWLQIRMWPRSAQWILFAAMFAGMLASTWQRRSLRVERPPARAWLRTLLGGSLMGFGAALAPGGNDALILYGIPSLSPHAVPAYLTMVAGIAAALIAMRAWFGIEMRVECRGDVCINAPYDGPDGAIDESGQNFPRPRTYV
jgi:uncharacterized membrane protein YedE/YeeE